ncbi:MAG: LysR family transcriptional regulator [Myxococcota bacterium]
MNWDDLRFVLALARHRTLVAAGKALGTSHTTVLRRLRNLEAELDVTLFDRTTEGWAPTSAGERLRDEAERLEAAIGAAVGEVRGHDRAVFGPVVLAAPESVARELLPPILEPLLAAHPGLRLDLRVGLDLVDLGRREADLAIRFAERPPESLLGRRLGRSQLRLCASPSYVAARGDRFPDTPEGHRFVLVGSGSPAYDALDLASHPASVLEVDHYFTAGALCRAGLGIAEVPDFLIRRSADFIPLRGAPARPSVQAWLLMRADLRSRARIRVVADALHDGLRAVFEGRPEGEADAGRLVPERPRGR